jgi:hypothetical protein
VELREAGQAPGAALPSGLYFGADDVVFSLGGAVVGILGQGIGDAFSGSVSSWQDYVGSALGGAAGGEALLYTGPIGSGAIGGLTTNLIKQGLKNATGAQCGFDPATAIADTAIGAATGFIPGFQTSQRLRPPRRLLDVHGIRPCYQALAQQPLRALVKAGF